MQRSSAVRRTLLAAVVVLSAFGLQTSNASAARVSLRGKDTANLRFTAARGERNRAAFVVGVTKPEVRGRGARLHAGHRCRARSSHVVVCWATQKQRHGFGWIVQASLRDRNDRAR